MARPDRDRIGGSSAEHIEVDESLVGGRTCGEGRGVHPMALVVAIVDTIVDHLLQRKQIYQELGPDYFECFQRQCIQQNLAR
jgi:hypothetical protein